MLEEMLKVLVAWGVVFFMGAIVLAPLVLQLNAIAPFDITPTLAGLGMVSFIIAVLIVE